MIRRLTFALIIALFAAGLRPPIAHAHPQAINISVGQDGFEQRVDYTIDVEAGHEVTITFTYADSDLADDNPHEIRVKGLGLELPTVIVSRANPTATITFTPEKSGRLRILCVVPCIGMENLVSGQITVARPKATGALTSLTLTLKPRDDGSILARAILQDASGNPIPNVPVIFTLRTSLGGDLVLGTPTTVDDGNAVVKIPATGVETAKVTAMFEGGNGLAYVEARSEIAAPALPMNHRPTGLSAPTPPPVLALALIVVVGGVWAAYAYVAYQVAGIRRAKTP